MDTKIYLQTLKSLLTLPHLRQKKHILPPENGMLGKWADDKQPICENDPRMLILRIKVYSQK